MLAIACGILSQVVGGDILRLVGRDNDAEQFHLLIFRESTNFDELALLRFSGTPTNLVNPLVGLAATAIVY